jgi:hypothetical protein
VAADRDIGKGILLGVVVDAGGQGHGHRVPADGRSNGAGAPVTAAGARVTAAAATLSDPDDRPVTAGIRA